MLGFVWAVIVICLVVCWWKTRLKNNNYLTFGIWKNEWWYLIIWLIRGSKDFLVSKSNNIISIPTSAGPNVQCTDRKLRDKINFGTTHLNGTRELRLRDLSPSKINEFCEIKELPNKSPLVRFRITMSIFRFGVTEWPNWVIIL